MADRYAAFISYSQHSDVRLATALQHALPRIAKPFYRLRTMRVFRDNDSLSGNDNLWGSIQAALDASSHLIVMASPEAAANPNVSKEVEYWLAHKPVGTLLIAVCGGTIAWGGNDFDRSATDCLPPALYGRFAHEPRWVDLRGLPSTVSLRVPAFHDKVAEFAAPLRGVSKEDLIGEDVRQNRRTKMAIWGAVAALTVLTLAAGAFAVDARLQKNEADRQRAVAVEQARLATARQLAAQANDADDLDMRLAARLDMASLAIHDDPATRANLLRTLAGSPITASFTAGLYGVTAVAISPDGRTLAMGGNRSVVLWDLTTPRPRQLGKPLLAQSLVTRVAFVGDGATLAAYGFPGRVTMWRLSDRSQPPTLGSSPADPDSSYGYGEGAVSPNGGVFVTGGIDGTVKVWDIGTLTAPQLRATLKGDGSPIHHVAYSADGRTVAVANMDKKTMLFDLSHPERPVLVYTITGTADTGASVAFSANAALMATADADRGVEVWDVRNPAKPRPMGAPLGIQSTGTRSLAFSPDGTAVAAGGHDDTIAVWNISTRAGVTLVGHVENVDAVAFTPDGRSLASGSADDTTIIWNLPGTVAAQLTSRVVTSSTAFDPDLDAHTVAVSADGRRLAHGAAGLALWNFQDPAHPSGTSVDTGNLIANAAAYSPNGRILAVGGVTGGLQLWDSEAEPKFLSQAPANDELLSVAFAPDGLTLAAGDLDGTIQLWSVADVHAPKRVASVQAGPDGGSATAIAFSAERHVLAAAGSAGTVYLWDVTDAAGPKPIGQLAGQGGNIESLAFSPDGTILAAGNNKKTVWLWDVSGLAHPRHVGQPLTDRVDEVTALAFTRDGRTLLTSGPAGVAAAWNVTDPQHAYRQADLRVPSTDGVVKVAYSADASTMITVGSSAISRWDLRSVIAVHNRPIDQACGFAGGGLTKDEWASLIPDLPYVDTCPA